MGTEMNNFYRLFAFYILLSLPLSANSFDKENSYVGASYGIGIVNKFGYYRDDGLAVVRPKNSHVFGLSLGYKINDIARVEMAFNRFDKFDYNNKRYLNKTNGELVLEETYSQKNTANAIFANLYFDNSEFGAFKPYMNIGVGVSINKSGDLNLKTEIKEGHSIEHSIHANGATKNEFAWNVGAGLSYDVSKKLSLDLISYKYYGLGKIYTKLDDGGESAKAKLNMHSINAGIRVRF
jgi:opacity protein-like surface antigen